MRVPLVRFGNDDRPIEPWEWWLGPIVLPIVMPLTFVVVVLMSATAAALVLGHLVVSPVLPRSWRLNWETAFDLDPSVNARCPACAGPLALSPVDKRGHVLRAEGQARELIMPSQAATCPQCQRAFNRVSLGKVWSPWEPVRRV